MDHHDHVRLIREAVPERGGVWADLGSGSGAFSLALAELIGPEGEIFAVDRDGGALRRQAQAMQKRFGDRQPLMHYLTADFTRPLGLPPLDGILMANALHFQRSKKPVLKTILSSLVPNGRFILVEYNTDRGNHWVPYPLSYSTWEALAEESGFMNTHKLAAYPSRFLGEIYSAESLAPGRSG